jgi:catechol 2,3-dioxygenase-like lactoylglutathione lyase family enzyme
MIKSIDHIVLTTRDLDKCVAFYVEVLGMRLENYGAGRIAFRFGDQKFNVHPPGFDASIKARTPTPGLARPVFSRGLPARRRDRAPEKAWHRDRRRPVGAHRRALSDPLGLRARSGRQPGRDLRAGQSNYLKAFATEGTEFTEKMQKINKTSKIRRFSVPSVISVACISLLCL